MALWGGRFEGGADALFKAFNDSLSFDARLVEHDIEGSIHWAAAIHRAGVISAEELAKVQAGLRDILAQLEANPRHILDSKEEDVHSYVETELVKRVGDLGKKLHTGRSRNDQVATDLRLFTRGVVTKLVAAIRAAQASLVSLAEREKAAPLPGYTHLQRGQPITFGHWAMAYVEMLDRDADRFADALKRINVSPLGSGALAGTAYPIDRAQLAKDLGFAAPTRNSLDGVSDRDFVFETLAACSLCAIHLSRFAEDLIIYATAEFAFVSLHDSVTSGSSLMPQKKNPDALELLRGKTGRVLGALTTIATTLKGLPLAYNKDLQEDKEPLFDATDHLLLCLTMLPKVTDTLVLNRATTHAAADDGFSAATDLADYLVRKGVPFRDAHHIAGRLVRLALAEKVPLHKLTLAQMQSVDSRIENDLYPQLTVEATLSRRDVIGGTAVRRVEEQIAAARKRLG